jgi:serine O-acetyltransferase
MTLESTPLAHDDPAAQPVAVATTEVVVSARVPDWSREAKRFWAWQPSRSLLASLRAYERLAGARGPWSEVLRKWTVVRHAVWSVITGADIPLGCVIGGGLLLPHPNGVVIHVDAEIGPNCLIFQQVTLGALRGGVPKLGGHVDVGAGAKILGAIRIGDDVLIGANAVVLEDVPAGATAVGIPAVPVRCRAEQSPGSVA